MLMELKERIGAELDALSRRMAALAPENGEELGAVQARMRRLGQLVAGLATLGDPSIPLDRVGYGSEVEVEDLRTGMRETYTIVTGEVLNLDENHVTLASALGQALLGRRRNDQIVVDLPQGHRRLRIVELTTLPRMLGGIRERESSEVRRGRRSALPRWSA